ncbi:BrnA antitoxin family protein [Aureimonas leprariae]|uniref:BrnA antitoxin family protein n=1 Tax=Plantimonas leprariae TaxID=2615207 RepID=A0A7V7PNW5_9HYPH|nr:BrnA antitoxin family protein [Aureimonas leprariae]KAB0679628.1 BrnA antitoxin family protein [Aureimonas leprariae]
MTTARAFRPLTDAEEARIQEGIRRDPDNPEWTKEDFANAKPFAEVFPELAASIERERRGTSVRLDPDIVEKFRRTGEGWEARVNEVLRKAEIEEPADGTR